MSSFYEVVLHPGKALRSAAHYEGTREFLTVQQGTIRLIAGGENSVLQRRRFGTLSRGCSALDRERRARGCVAFLVDIYRKE